MLKKLYKWSRLVSIFLIIILILIAFALMYFNVSEKNTLKIVTTPLVSYLENYKSSDDLPGLLTRSLNSLKWLFISITILIAYMVYAENRYNKILNDNNKRKLDRGWEIKYLTGCISFIIIIFVLNLFYYRNEIKEYVTEKKFFHKNFLKHTDATIINKNEPPFIIDHDNRNKPTLQFVSNKIGLSIERTQLYALLWVIYKGDTPFSIRHTDPSDRFQSLERYQLHMLCKEDMGCIDFINRAAPMNRSLIIPKILLLKRAEQSSLATVYFSSKINVIFSDNLKKYKDVIYNWAEKVDQYSDDPDKVVTIINIMYQMNIDPTVENLSTVEQVLNVIDYSTLNPKISVGFLSSCIDVDPLLSVPVPKDPTIIKILKERYK